MNKELPSRPTTLEETRRGFYQVADDRRYGADHDTQDECEPLRKVIAQFQPRVVVEIGCGLQNFHAQHPGWIGVDISVYALTKLNKGRRLCGDWSIALPFRSSSIPFVISAFVLEHLPDPERSLEELDRILAPGGIAYLRPAFNVPQWRANGLEYLDGATLSFVQRLAKRTLVVRRLPLWRFVTNLVWGRLLDEIQYLQAKRRGTTVRLRWKKLMAYEKAFLGPDSDAVSAFDKSAVAVWFLSRGYRVLPESDASSLLSRILARHSAIIVRKSESSG